MSTSAQTPRRLQDCTKRFIASSHSSLNTSRAYPLRCTGSMISIIVISEDGTGPVEFQGEGQLV